MFRPMSPCAHDKKPRNAERPAPAWARLRAGANAALVLIIVALLTVDHVLACGAPPPIVCSRSTSLVKAFAGPMVVAPVGGLVAIPVGVFVSATANAMPPCPAPVSTTVTLTSACVPPPSSPPGSIVIPTPAPGAYGGVVTLFFPPGPPRVCTITGSATTTWADGVVTVGFGDITICLVDPAPGNPAIPRLDMQLITPANVQAHPGDGRTHVVVLTNNDPANSVTGTFTSTSNQNGRLSTMSPPAAPGSGDGPGSVGSPFTGDALPIDFGDPLQTPCVPLPDPDANSTMTITKPITLMPGETRVVQVRQRSWPMCRSGSCSEALMKFEGVYTDTTPALACAQATFMVNSLVASDFEWPDNGMMTRVLPHPQGIVHQGNLPFGPFTGLFTLESAPDAPGHLFQFLGPRSQVLDQGFGDNMGRVVHDYVVSPPLNTGQVVHTQLFVDVSSLLPGTTATLQSAMVKSGDPALGDSYFFIMTRSRLSGPAIPPTIDSFFDVFYAVSLDGISGGLHRGARIFPGSVSVTPTGPTAMTVSFDGVFESGPLPPLMDRMEVHVDPIGNLIGVPPRHDRCTGAYPLSEGVQFMGDTTNAIGGSDGPAGSCAGGLFHAVWHTFTPASSGMFDIDTCGTSFDTVVVAFAGPDCSSLTEIGCDDDSTSGTRPPCSPNELASRIENLPLVGGQTYWIRVGGFNTSTHYGPYKVLVSRVAALGPCCIGSCCTVTNQSNCPGTWLGPGGTCNPNPCPRPSNDRCADATPVALGSPVSGDNCNATGDQTVSCASGSPANTHKSVWHTFTPTHTAEYELNTCGTTFDTLLAVFTTDCTIFSEVACNDDSSSAGSILCPGNTLASRIRTVNLTAGQTYHIEVAAWSTGVPTGGPYTLTVNNNNPLGACCTVDGCLLTDSVKCPGQFLPGALCSPTVCPPLGACCLAGACTVTSEANCPGRWLGAGVGCNPNPCNRGACCRGSMCVVTEDTQCTGAFAHFAGHLVPCNAPGNNQTPCCKADFNQNGTLSVQDIFDFLAAYFANDLRADFNGNGVLSVQDLFDFLAGYFAGC